MGEARTVTLAGRGRVSAALLFFALMLAALSVRLPSLEDRPFHTDEAVNAFILEERLAQGYQYRAHDHHGPSLYYLAGAVLHPFGIQRAAQMEAWMLRSVSLACGVLVVGLLALLRAPMGMPAALAAGVLVSLAAPFVYYSGIFIHEMLLMALLLLFFVSFWRLHDTGKLFWAAWSGVFAGLMLATKETAAIILPVVGPAVIFAHRSRGTIHAESGGDTAHTPTGVSAALGVVPRLRNYAVVGLAALAAVAVFYSDFGRKPENAFDLFRAVGPQVGRGLGQEHAYPWWTYFAWALQPSAVGVPWSGWVLLVLGAAGAVITWRNALSRAAVIWAVGLLAVFSLLPYKTPWLMLAWMLPLCLLAGQALTRLAQRSRLLAVIVGVAAVFLLGVDLQARCRKHEVNPANSLAYSPSSPDLARLERDLRSLAPTRAGGAAELPIHVVAKDYWPLPWVLRRYPKTGFWTEPPSVSHEGVLFTGPEYLDHYATAGELRPYELRPGVFIFFREPPAAR